MSKENFRAFVKKNPNIVKLVDKGTTWQELYEKYDMLGEDHEMWNIPDEQKNTNTTSNSSFDWQTLVKGLDQHKIQSALTSVQKLLGVMEGFFVKDEVKIKNPVERPLFRKFED